MDLNSMIIFMEGRSILDRDNFFSDDRFILECLRQLKAYKESEKILFRSKHTVTATSPQLKKLYGEDLNNSKYIELKNKYSLQLLVSGCTHAISSMSLGADLIFALAVIDLKKTGHDIRLECVLPFEDYYKKWKKENKEIVEYILENADTISYISKEFSGDVFSRQTDYVLEKIDEIISIDPSFENTLISRGIKNGKTTTLIKIA